MHTKDKFVLLGTAIIAIAIGWLLPGCPNGKETSKEPLIEKTDNTESIQPQNNISSIEEMTERLDGQGNVIERTTRIVIYSDKVEAEG